MIANNGTLANRSWRGSLVCDLRLRSAERSMSFDGSLDEICSAEAGDFQLFAGSTSWEGAGFVAVEQRSTGHLLWLLHLSDAEQFTEISSDGATIQAISEEYPFRSEWHIPIHLPESLTVTQVRDG